MNSRPIVPATAALLAGGGLVLALAASGTASSAQQTTTHRLSFTSHTLQSRQVRNELVETDKAVKAGRTIGYTANSCTFDFQKGLAHCTVAFARPAGQLRSRVTVDAQTGKVSGRIVGGSGAYRGATGTVTGGPGSSQDSVRITMTWSN